MYDVSALCCDTLFNPSYSDSDPIIFQLQLLHNIRVYGTSSAHDDSTLHCYTIMKSPPQM